MTPERPFYHHALMICDSIHADLDVAIRLIQRDRATSSIKSVSHHRLARDELIRQFPMWQRQGLEPFMLVGLNDGTGFGAKSMYGTWAIAVDLDYDVDMTSWSTSPVRPSIAINTSFGRQHLIWVLEDELIDADTFSKFATAMAFRLGGDPVFANLTQAVRLPGFVNQKHGNEVAVSLPRAGEDMPSYDLAMLANGFDVELASTVLRSHYSGFTLALTMDPGRVADEASGGVLNDLSSALNHIDSEPYDVWIRVLAALVQFGEEGRALAERWSRTCTAKFDQIHFDRTWKSFAKSDRRQVNAGSIFHMAARAGWSNPGFGNDSKTSEGSPPTDRELGEQLSRLMVNDYVAVRVGTGEKQSLIAQRWDGARYVAQDKWAFRKAVASLVESKYGRKSDDGLRNLPPVLKNKIGNATNLDAVGMAALEYLVECSEGREANSFPYFPVSNGVLNMLSGQLVPTFLRPVSQKYSPVRFDPSASAPAFMKALGEIFEGDEEMVAFFLRLAGYVMLGVPKEHKLVVFYGSTGRNGKSLLVDLLRSVLGDFAAPLPTNAIMVKSTMTDGATPSFARLRGVRMAIISEPNKKQQLDTGLIKQMTGGDQIVARALYEAEVVFMPEFTPVLVTNVLPTVHEDDDAMWARLLIVPFMRTFGPDEIDPDLKDKLRREASGILNCLLAGARDYLNHGLRIPDKCRLAAHQQRKDADPVEHWLADCVEEDQGRCALAALFTSYSEWAKANPSFQPLSKRDLSKKLEARYRKTTSGNLPHFWGIRLHGRDAG